MALRRHDSRVETWALAPDQRECERYVALSHALIVASFGFAAALAAVAVTLGARGEAVAVYLLAGIMGVPGMLALLVQLYEWRSERLPDVHQTVRVATGLLLL